MRWHKRLFITTAIASVFMLSCNYCAVGFGIITIEEYFKYLMAGLALPTVGGWIHLMFK